MRTLFLLFAFASGLFAQDISCPAFLAETEAAAGGSGNPLTNSIYAYWKMDEASGNRADSTGRGNTLVDNNTVTSGTGRVGNGAQFTAANSEWLSVNDNPDVSLGDEDWTFAFWFKQDTLSNYQTAAGKDNAFLTYADVSGLMVYRSATEVNDEIAVINSGEWYFVVLWWVAATDTKGWAVNAGTAGTSSGVAAPTDGTGQFTIGRFPDNAFFYFNGIIDEVGLWKRVLTSDERTELYNSGSGKTYPFE